MSLEKVQLIVLLDIFLAIVIVTILSKAKSKHKEQTYYFADCNELPDDQNNHQREDDCDQLGERPLTADELSEWMGVWEARDHQDRNDDGEER